MALRLNGQTSGYVELDAPATAGSNTLVLPNGNGTANQFLKNSGTAGTLEYSSLTESSGNLSIATGNTLTAADEGAIRAPGMILQRQIDNSFTGYQLTAASHQTVFSSSTFNAIRANSRIHIMCHVQHGKRQGTGEHQFAVRLLRNGSLVTAALSSSTNALNDVIRFNTTDVHMFTTFHFYDEPNSTANITYAFQAAKPVASYPDVYFNFAGQSGSTMIIDELAR